jgi:hypothetical protein
MRKKKTIPINNPPTIPAYIFKLLKTDKEKILYEQTRRACKLASTHKLSRDKEQGKGIQGDLNLLFANSAKLWRQKSEKEKLRFLEDLLQEACYVLDFRYTNGEAFYEMENIKTHLEWVEEYESEESDVSD